VNNDHNIVFAGDHPAQTISSRLKRGDLRQIARGAYTSELSLPIEDVVRQNWRAIVGRQFPDAVITDRSIRTAGPVDGYLWLSHDARNRVLVLPGITIVARRGAGPQPTDIAMPGGLHLASVARALAENAVASRASAQRPRRTMDLLELDGWIEHLCAQDGENRIRRYRNEAEQLAEVLGVPAGRIAILAERIGLAVGTADAMTSNRALHARSRGAPFDPDCLRRCDVLADALRNAAPQNRRGLSQRSIAFQINAFFEAYFSNYIEGTTFDLDEAHQIIDQERLIPNRHADSHDVLGTYKIVSDPVEMSRLADNPAEFIDLMRIRHGVIMKGRPQIAATFKDQINRAGNTLFVAPHLVSGTIIEGWRRLAELDTAWERAVYTMFLVADVHPFVDGNGRIARVMMNAELVAGDQSKIIIPTPYRTDYLGALRRLTRDNDPSILVKAMRFAHDWTSRIDWSSDESARADLAGSHAFDDDDDALLRMPR
jgi:hypothetical protein